MVAVQLRVKLGMCVLFGWLKLSASWLPYFLWCWCREWFATEVCASWAIWLVHHLFVVVAWCRQLMKGRWHSLNSAELILVGCLAWCFFPGLSREVEFVFVYRTRC